MPAECPCSETSRTCKRQCRSAFAPRATHRRSSGLRDTRPERVPGLANIFGFAKERTPDRRALDTRQLKPRRARFEIAPRGASLGWDRSFAPTRRQRAKGKDKFRLSCLSLSPDVRGRGKPPRISFVILGESYQSFGPRRQNYLGWVTYARQCCAPSLCFQA